MKKEDFLKAVSHEVEQLKAHATKEELERLKIENFDPFFTTQCIYGQMAERCDSERAKELMDKACIKTFGMGDDGLEYLEDENFDTVKKYLKEEYKGQTWVDNGIRTYKYISALEGYIALKDAKVEHIFEYLQDKVKTLKLS